MRFVCKIPGESGSGVSDATDGFETSTEPAIGTDAETIMQTLEDSDREIALIPVIPGISITDHR